MRAKIDFCPVPEGLPSNSVVVKDIGHDKGFASITNDAEEVVQTVLRVLRQLNEPGDTKIFYYDSDGRLDELKHDGVMFVGFAPGPKELQSV